MYCECRHIKTSGERCHSPALRDNSFCYFHANLHRITKSKASLPSQPMQFPPLEDARAIQIALSQVIDAIASSRIDHRCAGLLLYALQIAAQVTPRRNKDDDPETVREVCSEQDGEVIATERPRCEPGIDCDKCRAKNKCLSLQRINHRSLKKIFTSWKNGQDISDQKNRDREAKITRNKILTGDANSPKTLRDV
jgi:hypothetical protein